MKLGAIVPILIGNFDADCGYRYTYVHDADCRLEGITLLCEVFTKMPSLTSVRCAA